MGYTTVAWLVQKISREEGIGADAVGWRAVDMLCRKVGYKLYADRIVTI